MTLLRAFIGVETAVLTFRKKQCSTCHSSHICYGKRFHNDFFLNHHTIALVNNCLIFLSCVIIETALDLILIDEKKSIILTVSFQLENVPFNIQSYRFGCNDAMHVHRQLLVIILLLGIREKVNTEELFSLS